MGNLENRIEKSKRAMWYLMWLTCLLPLLFASITFFCLFVGGKAGGVRGVRDGGMCHVLWNTEYVSVTDKTCWRTIVWWKIQCLKSYFFHVKAWNNAKTQQETQIAVYCFRSVWCTSEFSWIDCEHLILKQLTCIFPPAHFSLGPEIQPPCVSWCLNWPEKHFCCKVTISTLTSLLCNASWRYTTGIYYGRCRKPNMSRIWTGPLYGNGKCIFNADINSIEVFRVSSRNWNEVLLFKIYWNLWMLIMIEMQVKLPWAFRNSLWKVWILSGFLGIYDHLKSMR